MVMKFINFLILCIGKILQTVLDLFPDTPFRHSWDFDNSFLKGLNYIFPVQSIISHLALYCVCVAVYYASRVVARWIKLVQN